ncbi:D-tyrosyl-tRNA(Tyr) deacylase [Dethiosulfatibacter aminovorans DSM 17477]|uniref:D-aminoacyl-tRNA deacylase n=1 Tax=Dethiosulfatibacter aminovorans DSM 17477 TaxID=1121476 RepID=A0A1M6D491_9FIRM|nr:D-aminoacyl-tRNA deacylase [Dethiosulfatibacter aminovorans]SHI68092.1 D-tyrosyl-tRNA(Tyr) deacylase [Dethiosulfatibacter aminovorans DSM 17477]
MRAVIQRVKEAEVRVDDSVTGKINKGLLVFLGVAEDDTDKDLSYMIDKSLNLRIFEDDQGKMNLSLKDIEGEMLVISQFTIMGDARKGRRPSFTGAGNPVKAEAYYNEFIEQIKCTDIKVESGVFAADMDIELINDGPVTILLDSTKLL